MFMSSAQDILKQAEQKVKPSAEERKRGEALVGRLMKTASEIAKEYSAKALMCGSWEKNTWLAQKHELDLFILFSPLLPRKQLENYGMTIAKAIIEQMGGGFHIAYAEHPYVCGTVRDGSFDWDIDIVPCYDVRNPAKIKSAVDRTPHHVKYIKANLRLPDDVRLLKAFCMGAGCYGADLKTQGFSGYLCELIVLNYGRFLSCLKEIAKWKAPVVIDLISDRINKERLFDKFKVPLIFIDPVDPNRNVAAAVSAESFYKLVRAARDFLKSPSLDFFSRRKIKPYSGVEIGKEINRRGTRWYIISFDRPAVIDDILWPQLRKAMNAFQTIMHEHGFEVLRADCWANGSCALVFEMKEWQVPRIEKNVGPNIFTRHADKFLEHYKQYKIFIEGNNWVVELERPYTTVLFLLKDLLSKGEADLKKKGIPSHIAKALADAKISAGAGALKAVGELPEEFRSFMRDWFERDLNPVE